jgi:hypothetical protein
VALTESSRWSDFGSKLSELSAAAEWGRAEADGVVRPSRKGVDKDYDAAQAAVDAAEQELQVRGGGGGGEVLWWWVGGGGGTLADLHGVGVAGWWWVRRV